MNDLEERVVGLIAQLVPLKPQHIKLDHRLREDLGMDSVSSMELLSLLSEDLDLDLGIEDVADVQTVGGAVALVRKFLDQKAA